MTPTLLTGRLLLSTLEGCPTVPCGRDSNVIGEGKGQYRVRWVVRVKGLTSVPYVAEVYRRIGQPCDIRLERRTIFLAIMNHESSLLRGGFRSCERDR